MKTFLRKLGGCGLGLLLRLAWVIAAIIIWSIWSITIIPFVLIEVIGLLTVIPIAWILVGTKYTEKLMCLLYYHRNHDLWYWDGGDYSFYFSLYPIWSFYLQTKLDDWLEDAGNTIEKKYLMGYDE